MGPGTPAVELTQVTRVFGVLPGVVRVDLRVEQGEVLLVRGPNGAGKTTLLRLIATAIGPTYGGGSVLGHDLLRDRDRIRGRVELMGHRGRFYLDLTGAENLRFATSLYSRPVDSARLQEVVERVGLAASAGDRVRTYSQGMRQRLALGRMLLRQADVVLLDEPYSGLDRDARELINDVLREIRGDGRTAVVASHEPIASDAATRTVTMDRGRLFEVPVPITTEAVHHRPTLETTRSAP